MTKQDQISLLQTPPAKGEVKRYEQGATKFDYIPIEIMLEKADKIFGVGNHSFKVIQALDSYEGFQIVVEFVGVFADGTQIISHGAGASSVEYKKESNKPMSALAFPKALTEAKKNALRDLGEAFGRSLNRDDDYTGKRRKLSQSPENAHRRGEFRSKLQEVSEIHVCRGLAQKYPDFADLCEVRISELQGGAL